MREDLSISKLLEIYKKLNTQQDIEEYQYIYPAIYRHIVTNRNRAA